MPSAVVKEQPRSTAQRGDNQIQVDVAINVCKCRAHGELSGASDPCAGGHIFEAPVAEIAIECVGIFQPAKIDVAQIISIHVTQSEAGAVEANLVLCRSVIRESICKTHPSADWIKKKEAILTLCRNRDFRRTKPWTGFPIQTRWRRGPSPIHCQAKREQQSLINSPPSPA